ncbi:MAG: Crp/Fnr family transcriptional regulator [Pirellulales bacterium]
MAEKLWFLKHSKLLSSLSEDELQTLERNAVVRTFEKHQMVYLPSEPGRTVLVVLRGRVKLKDVTPDGKETILAFLDEGELFGELSLFDEAPRSEFAEAVEQSDVLALRCDDLQRLMEQKPELILQLTKLVGLRRRRIETRLRNLLFRTSRERVAHLLVELVESHGQKSGEAWDIRLPLSHQDLAGLVGATRESVTLALGHLQLDRLIRVSRRHIRVLNLRGLIAETMQSHDPTSLPTGANENPILEASSRRV